MTSLKCISVMTTCSVFGALLAIIFEALWTLNQLNTVTLILTGLLALENVHRGGNNEGYEKPENHMTLEYKTGEMWGPFTAPRANRFIVHNDHRNPFLRAVEWLEDALKNFQPRLLIVSGIQMMDTFKFEPGVREARIEKVKEQMITQPRNTLIHFEMASYFGKDVLSLIEKNILPYTDSIGMNEEEVANLNQKLSKDPQWDQQRNQTLAWLTL
ncbi:unnamed protein product [Hermetia illucens]|uniref:Uncharacterized protein n=1 Tax=Hermetia illucens TaxID=343691 RepID=A0A7R8UHL7_HERIL|nr:unnamed protein product [Hermetia illucens]